MTYEPAFPFVCNDVSKNQVVEAGMSLWDYFAAAALSGADPNDPQTKPEWCAGNAAKYADAMMLERAKRQSSAKA